MTTVVAGQLVTAAQINQWAPPGAIIDYGGTTAPSGWFICDGSAVSRTTYAALFTAIGVLWGVGDGSTTFNLPDYRGRTPVGYAPSGGHTDVSTIGLNDSVALANRRPKHRTTNALTASQAAHNHGTGDGTNTNFQIAQGGGGAASSTGPGPGNTPGGTLKTTTDSQTPAVTLAGSIGTNVANDPLDTPAYAVANRIIRAIDA